jgi:hypothetical protein
MKRIAMIGGLILMGSQAFCQNKIVVMLEQIAKYEVYLSYLKKGYDIVNKGLTLIGDIKHGDFNLHKDYFNSLDNVNPAIKSDVKIAAMIAMQAEMLSGYQAYYKRYQAAGIFTNRELSYLYRVFTALLDDVAEDITELTQVITDGQLQMKDDERINRIDRLYSGMTGKYNFLYSFGDQVQVHGLQRQKELQETQFLKKMY